MKALVLGLGMSGKSAKALLERRGVDVVTCDDALEPKEFSDLSEFDLFVPSPGISPKHPLYKQALSSGIQIKGEVELFLEETDQLCIGITGTNGKTTMALLITHMLNCAGKRAVCGGNVGAALSSIDKQAICVLELSSFQLETMKTRGLDMGIFLNFTPDHLDRYPSFEDYRDAKIAMEHVIKEEGKLFVHESIDPKFFTRPIEVFAGGSVEIARRVCEELGVRDFASLKTFQRPPHRLEFVEEIDGVVFINDSKATNVEATIHALSEVKHELVLILGGKDKGLCFASLSSKVPSSCRVVIYGEAREKIANQLQPLSEVHKVETLREAVDLARSLARAHDVVLFSPGCASFDAFSNYEERGEAFKQYVRRRI